MYNDRQIELLDRFNGKVQPYMIEARQRGVLFDLGHGAGSFLWTDRDKAMEQNFYRIRSVPISTLSQCHGEPARHA